MHKAGRGPCRRGIRASTGRRGPGMLPPVISRAWRCASRPGNRMGGVPRRPHGMSYRFGTFVYDPVERVLLRDGVEVPLSHKSRELLVLFLENPRHLLTREKIVEKVWGDAAVTDDALRAQIAKLRRALGDAGDDLVEMVRREGYRWNGDVQVEAEAAAPSRPRSRSLRATPPVSGSFSRIARSSCSRAANVIGRDSESALWIDHRLGVTPARAGPRRGWPRPARGSGEQERDVPERAEDLATRAAVERRRDPDRSRADRVSDAVAIADDALGGRGVEPQAVRKNGRRLFTGGRNGGTRHAPRPERSAGRC